MLLHLFPVAIILVFLAGNQKKQEQESLFI
ncbi:hypothetical protein AHMF7616_03634 [Adhaeribacter pallidiroseus]|uniref:Uncharacterized protein n=1 Tax=Adhaeribacter pallidiroseus TaxID=2072847 RepID=A0A369QJC7_9BACT|nr:hypothetical protein AHMF7616_03634 [Adhaeribacter pallidiroseus]